MRYTLDHAAKYIARHADGGMAPNDPRLYDRINEAICRFLMMPGLWQGCIRTMRFNVRHNSFTAPSFVQSFIKAKLDGHRTDMHSPWYEFMDSGFGIHSHHADMQFGNTGENGYWVNASGLIVDQGDSDPVQNQPLMWQPIFAISSQEETVPRPTITVMGLNEYNEELWTQNPNGNATPGIKIEIAKEQAILSTVNVWKITNIIKPVTRGYVRLYSYNPRTKTVDLLSTYAPDETNPGYRKYWISGTQNSEGAPYQLSTGQLLDRHRTLYARTKLRYAPAMYPDEVLLIQNLPAIKMMVQAIKLYDTMNPKEAQIYEQQAHLLLADQLQAENPPNNEIDYEAENWMSIPNIM